MKQQFLSLFTFLSVCVSAYAQNTLPATGSAGIAATKGWKDIFFTGGLFVDEIRFFKAASPLTNGSTFFGYESGPYNTTDGIANTGFGFRSLFVNTTGLYNTAIGIEALFSNVRGSSDNAVGYAALHANNG